jgi:hypothetical protein
MSTKLKSQWDPREVGSHTKEDHTSTNKQSKQPRRDALSGKIGIWLNSELQQRETTANLDDQDPATLYYLGRVIKLDDVVQVYVDRQKRGSLKHWTVIESRDFDVMDQIYDIELDTREKFPYANIDFRVTVYTDSGPSAAHQSMKIYDA